MTDLPAIVVFSRVSRGPRLGARWCTPSQVLGVVDHLRAQDFHPIGLDRVADLALDSSCPLPPRAVALGFEFADDVFGEVVWPALAERSTPVALFVDTGYVGQRRRSGPFGRDQELRLSWAELAALRSDGLVLGTRGHYDVEHGRFPEEVAFGDLVRSRREMERRLGESPRLLRHPGSRVSDTLAELAGRVGFELGLVRGRPAHSLDLLRVGSVDVGRLDRPAAVVRRVRAWVEQGVPVPPPVGTRLERRARSG